MKLIRTLALSVGVLAVVLPSKASAQEANGLGEKGELIITADRLMPLFSYTNITETETNNNVETKTSDSSTSLALLLGSEPNTGIDPHTVPRIAIDYTVINHLTIGGSFVLGLGLGGTHKTETGNNSSKNDAPKVTVVGFAPRVGYVLPLGHVFGFWPRAGIAVYSISQKTENTPNNPNAATTTTTRTDSAWSLDLDPQFVWVPLQHFFAHFGPILNIPFAGSRTVETSQGSGSQENKHDLSIFHFGISAGLGGWFDL